MFLLGFYLFAYNTKCLCMKKAVYKVPNGKLLKIFLDDKEGKIASIKITGDFFMHPENNIELLETHLAGATLEEKNLTGKIQNFLADHPTELFGVDVNSLVFTILQASSNLNPIS